MPPSSVSGASATSGLDARLEEAAAWYVRLCSGEAGHHDHAAWQRWHDSSPECRHAWSRVERMQGLLRQAPPQSRRTLGSAALRKTRRLAMAAGLFLVCGLSFLWLRAAPEAAVEWMATAPGERREALLPDGSRLVLGSASRVGVSFDADRRRILLREGSLQLTTGHDSARAGGPRPLLVQARDGLVRPLGTQFTLAQDATGSTLAVQAHAVEVTPQQGGFSPLRVEAGQRLRFSADTLGTPVAAQGSEDAWVRGQLVVLDMPLASFVSELAHQSGRQILCDARIAGLRVSGSYLVDQPRRSLEGIAALHGLRVETGADGALMLVPKRR